MGLRTPVKFGWWLPLSVACHNPATVDRGESVAHAGGGLDLVASCPSATTEGEGGSGSATPQGGQAGGNGAGRVALGAGGGESGDGSSGAAQASSDAGGGGRGLTAGRGAGGAGARPEWAGASQGGCTGGIPNSGGGFGGLANTGGDSDRGGWPGAGQAGSHASGAASTTAGQAGSGAAGAQGGQADTGGESSLGGGGGLPNGGASDDGGVGGMDQACMDLGQARLVPECNVTAGPTAPDPSDDPWSGWLEITPPNGETTLSRPFLLPKADQAGVNVFVGVQRASGPGDVLWHRSHGWNEDQSVNAWRELAVPQSTEPVECPLAVVSPAPGAIDVFGRRVVDGALCATRIAMPASPTPWFCAHAGTISAAAAATDSTHTAVKQLLP